MNFQGKTILITGSNGLFGFALCNYIYNLNLNTRVICISKNNPPKHFDNIFKNRNFTFIQCDMAKAWGFPLPKVNYIFHFACYGRPTDFMSDPISTILVNINATKRLLDLAQLCEAQLFFASTGEIYGDADIVPTPEDYPGNYLVQDERACYTESKKMGEVLCLTYNRLYDMKNKIGRIALAYGPGIMINDSRIMPTLIKRGEEGSVYLNDAGISLRNYLYIDDALSMILNIMDGKQDIYNIGGDETVSIADMAKKVAKIIKAPYRIPTTDSEYMKSPKLVKLSMDRYYDEFGKKSLVSFDEGLQKTIEWMSNG